MDSSGDESFVWSRASTSSEGPDADMLLKAAVKAEKEIKGKKSIKKEKMVKSEEAIKTELLDGAHSPVKDGKRFKKTRVKQESSSSSSDGDTKPVIDKFSADETIVETRRPRHSARHSTDSDRGRQNDAGPLRRSKRHSTVSDRGRQNDAGRPRRSTLNSTDSVTGRQNDAGRSRRSTRNSTNSDIGRQNNAGRPRRSTRNSTDSDTGRQNDAGSPRRSTRNSTDSDAGRPRRSTRHSTDSDTGRPRRSTRHSTDSDAGRPRRSTRHSTDSDTGRPRRSTRHSTDSDTGRPRRSTRHSTDSDTGRPRRSTRHSTDSDTGRPRRSTRHSTDSDAGRPRRSTRHSTDSESEHRYKNVNKSPKVSPSKPFTSNEYVSDSSDCDDIEKQNGNTSDYTRTKSRVNGHKDSDSSINSRAQKNKSRTSLSNSKSGRNTISDRIQFEDEEVSCSESHPEAAEQTNKLSSRMQRHLKDNMLLKQVDVAASATAWPGVDDELWLLHVPADFNEKALIGTTLTLDDKCKVKVDGQTYEGKSEGGRRVTLLTHRDGGCVIANETLVNSVRFRRKNPRPQAIEDDAHNDSQAVPMPVTKRRHPLFGVDYKKAIKLPSAVRKKLKCKMSSSREADSIGVAESMEVDTVQTDDAQGENDKRKKRKRKKERASDAAAVDVSYSGGDGSGAKRRRKHRDTQWDSEKAIEESLFNF